MKKKAGRSEKKLGELASTAICGNDITSSCLYVAALSILYAGKWAPVSLLIVVSVLYLYRSIYAEVVGALPLNGGAYNALLNTTSKYRASIAACLTLLSYMVTAVISATEAMHYAHTLWEGLPILPATIALLAVFMGLMILGITESAAVAVVIFLFHLSAIALLLGVGGFYVMSNGMDTFTENWSVTPDHGLGIALFFGFSAAMLGISGFESSANFVEEQVDGVFPKTLRNMWIVVSIVNPATAFLALAMVPIATVPERKEALLSYIGGLAGGQWLSILVSVDAAIVLSGAVLTSFVGVTGLTYRMTLDRCLPQFLLKTNRWGNSYRIVIGFFLLTVSVLFITRGDVKALAGVYTISFLAVMALFAFGNCLLKLKRAELPRPVRASWLFVIVGLLAVIAALIGNAVMNPSYLRVFLLYFTPAVLVVSIMLGRIRLMKSFLFVIRTAIMSMVQPMNDLSNDIMEWIDTIGSQQIVFFTQNDSIATLRYVMDYIGKNELTNRVKFVTALGKEEQEDPDLHENLEFLDKAYPDIDIEFVVVREEFGPKLVKKLSEKWNTPTNLMFIGSPRGHLGFGLHEMHGVRVII